MDEESVLQIVDEFLSSLEPLDTQSAALVQFLKAKGIASDEELAPFLQQAGNASNVRWLAARVRIKSLISSAMKTVESKPVEAPTEQGQAAKAESEEKKKESSLEASKGANDSNNQKERDPKSNTRASRAGDRETFDEEQESKKDPESKKKDEPKPAKTIDATSEKDNVKEGQAAPPKSDVKENAA